MEHIKLNQTIRFNENNDSIFNCNELLIIIAIELLHVSILK